ncbi:unnamed protein product [Brassica oleracea]
MAAVDSLQLNALSLTTWAVHVSSVVEWITAMALAERCTYGERILGSSSEYVQSNITRYFSDPQYYFKVNDQYVTNKLKVVLFPFLHRPLSKTSSCFASNDHGHWARISEPVGGRLSYKPPIYDINAPDLYIPFMAFGTYVVLAGLSLGLNGK